MKVWIGIDNGVTGTIGIINEEGHVYEFFKTPVIKCLDYTKAKKYIHRIDSVSLTKKLSLYKPEHGELDVLVLIERPMVNPTRFVATTSALRALEALLIIVESLGIPYKFIDSKEWQKAMLPKGIKGSIELKQASKEIGKRLFPQFAINHPDMDGLLIAEYGRIKKI